MVQAGGIPLKACASFVWSDSSPSADLMTL